MPVLAILGTIFFIVLFQYLSCFSIYIIIKLFFFSFRRCQHNIRLLLNEQFSLIIIGDIFLYLIGMVVNINILTSWLNTSNMMMCINIVSLFIFYLFNKDYLLNDI